jgi:hypothetical protein
MFNKPAEFFSIGNTFLNHKIVSDSIKFGSRNININVLAPLGSGYSMHTQTAWKSISMLLALELILRQGYLKDRCIE